MPKSQKVKIEKCDHIENDDSILPYTSYDIGPYRVIVVCSLCGRAIESAVVRSFLLEIGNSISKKVDWRPNLSD